MCGRFVLLTDLSVIMESFDIHDAEGQFWQSDNISPGQLVAAVVREGANRLLPFRWGLIPSWAKDPSLGKRLFNARAETVSEKPSFRNAFKKNRCLIVADGFYEWQKQGNRKTPFLFFLRSGQPFGFAGLYETWTSPDRQTVHTCTIITTDANELVKPVHDRMPVILPKEKESVWLDPENRNSESLRSLLTPYPAEKMEKLAKGPDSTTDI
jgi:putative SOS response-associated peptidase YedK